MNSASWTVTTVNLLLLRPVFCFIVGNSIKCAITPCGKFQLAQKITGSKRRVDMDRKNWLVL